jgi:hypothetical protein
MGATPQFLSPLTMGKLPPWPRSLALERYRYTPEEGPLAMMYRSAHVTAAYWSKNKAPSGPVELCWGGPAESAAAAENAPYL